MTILFQFIHLRVSIIIHFAFSFEIIYECNRCELHTHTFQAWYIEEEQMSFVLQFPCRYILSSNRIWGKIWCVFNIHSRYCMNPLSEDSDENKRRKYQISVAMPVWKYYLWKKSESYSQHMTTREKHIGKIDFV